MQLFAAFLAGLIFGIGILISGMSNPAKVQNFFDFAGSWDPSLAFVMGGALAVTAVGYKLVSANSRPVLAPQFNLPAAQNIDLPLLAGAAIFGIGWGLSGFCPGGVIPVLGIGRWEPVIFFIGLAAGIIVTRLLRQNLTFIPRTTNRT